MHAPSKTHINVKRYLIFFLLFILPSLVIGQNIENSLLWEIKNPELKQKSFLYGTIHMIKKSDFEIKEKVLTAFNSCDKLALEVNLDMSMKTMIEVAKLTMLPNKKTLRDFMTKKNFYIIKSYAIDSIGISSKKFKKYIRLKPFFFSSFLLKEELGKIKSYDEEFYKMSSKKNMTLIGLESIHYQMALLDKMSIKEQTKNLINGIIKNNDNTFDSMVEAYKKEDLQSLYNSIKDESIDIKGFHYDFIVKRNQNWIPVIEGLIRNKSTFIAVGAGHLPGEYGLISLLRKNGYSVVPVGE